MTCYVYGQMVAEDHDWENDGTTGPWGVGEGPLCIRCGLSRGTGEIEAIEDRERADRIEADQ